MQAEVVRDVVPWGEDQESQLPLRAGDRVAILKKDPSGWWAGHLQGGGDVGWFPESAVRALAPAPSTAHGAAAAGAALAGASPTAHGGAGTARGAAALAAAAGGGGAPPPQARRRAQSPADGGRKAEQRPAPPAWGGRRVATPLGSSLLTRGRCSPLATTSAPTASARTSTASSRGCRGSTGGWRRSVSPQPGCASAGAATAGSLSAVAARDGRAKAGATAAGGRSRRGSPCGAPSAPCAAFAREGAGCPAGVGGAGPAARQSQGPSAPSRGPAPPAAALARAARQRAPPSSHQFLPAQRLQAERIQRQQELEAERERSEQIIQELRLSSQERREVAARTRQLEEEIANLRDQMRQISQLDTVAERQKQLEGSLRVLQEECATEVERRRLLEGELARMQDELGGRALRPSLAHEAQECSLTASSLTFEVPAGGRADARSSLGASTIDLPAAGLLAGTGSGRSSPAGHTGEVEVARPGRVHELVAALEGRRGRPAAASPQEDLLSMWSPMMPGETLSAHGSAGTGQWS